VGFLSQQWQRFCDRVVWSLDGWRNIWQTEPSLKQWIVANCISTPLAIYLPLSAAETAIIVMGGIMVLAAECMNTAIERVVDDISMERRDLAKQAKDAGSAAVAVTAISVGAAWVTILCMNFL
jgi:diacylglycerol kinase (ATP)